MDKLWALRGAAPTCFLRCKKQLGTAHKKKPQPFTRRMPVGSANQVTEAIHWAAIHDLRGYGRGVFHTQVGLWTELLRRGRELRAAAMAHSEKVALRFGRASGETSQSEMSVARSQGLSDFVGDVG